METIAGWIIFILLQVTPVQNMDVGDVIQYTGLDGSCEIVLDAAPAPGYWSVKAQVKLQSSAPAQFFAAGYLDGNVNRLFTLHRVMDGGGKDVLFSVNQAGAPMPMLFLPQKGSQLFISSDDALVPVKNDYDGYGWQGGTTFPYRGSAGEAIITLKRNSGQDSLPLRVEFSFEDFFLQLQPQE